MNEADARACYARLANSWPANARGVPAETWIEVLTPLDAGTVGTAIIRLRDDLKHPPSIREFRDVYRSLHTPANDPIAGPYCDDCAGTGWKSVRAAENTVAEHVKCVRPCPCPAGRRTEQAHRTIDQHRRDHEQGPYKPKPETVRRPDELDDATLFGDHP